MPSPFRPHEIAEIEALLLDGRTCREVIAACSFGVGRSMVYEVRQRLVQRGRLAPLSSRKTGRSNGEPVVCVTLAVKGTPRIAALAAEAERRGLSRSALAARIVRSVIDDGLFTAVLDD